MTAPDPALEEVVALERRLLDADVRRRPDELGRLLHPDFREFGASGTVWTKASIVAALTGEPPVPRAMEDVDARVLGDDVLLVTYVARHGAGPAARRSLRSSLWVRGADGWRVLFHQGTSVAEPP